MNAPLKTPLVAAATGWHAKLHLGFRAGAKKTILADRLREGPLAVQRAFYPEGDLCHVYLLHPPGGVAGGDQLDIRCRVEPHAAALITTPGATKFYRSVGPLARQKQLLQVAENASLEWFPQENILFPDAHAELHTQVELHGNARFIGWEINCLGRPANDEPFDPGRALFRFSLVRDGQPLLHERLQVDKPAVLAGAAGLRNRPVFGTFIATLEDDRLLTAIRESLSQTEQHQFAASWVDGVLIVRYLGTSTERARQGFARVWQQLRPHLLHRPACPPRIWNT